MLKEYTLTAIRQFRKNPFYAGLNVLGLAVGTACFILIALHVEYETGYERALPHFDRIYRVTTDVRLRSGQNKFYAMSTSGLAAALKAEYPEVSAATKILPRGAFLRRGGVSFFERYFVAADPNFLKVFRYRLAAGDPSSALARPDSLLMTREMAVKYFGKEDPIGQTITADNEKEYVVTGVMEQPATPSHIRADFVVNPGEIPDFNHPTWNALGIFTYFELAESASPRAFESRIQDLAVKYAGPRGKELFYFRLQPIASIHLHSDREGDFAAPVGAAQVRLLSAVAVLILLAACVNFVNLATARAGRRAREVGVRKVLGARRGRLFRQFLFESFLATLAAFGLGLGLAYAVLPWFNSLWGASLSFDPGKHGLPLAALAALIGLLAGSYPALVLSSFRPGLMLKGPWGKAAGLLRRGLIVFQYSAAIALLLSTAVVASQMRYLRTKNLGFDRDRVLGVRLRSPDVVRGLEAIKRELLGNPDIVGAAAVSYPPGLQAAVAPYVPEGFEGNSILVRTLSVDCDFISVMGMKIAAGRGFSRDFPADAATGYVINRAAQVRFGWKEAVGKTIVCTNRTEPQGAPPGRVIGVLEDFHVRSLRLEVEPVILRILPETFQFLLLKLGGTNPDRALAFVESRMKTLQPQFPPETFFLDAELDELYGNERRLGRIFKAFAAVAILVACFGLLGLAAYDAELKTREIGIRRVLGASTPGILWLLTRESAGLVASANLIAWPAGYFLMEGWLRNFAFRVSVGPGLMIASGAAALALALATVGVQAYRAAGADPVDSLRYE